jgi:hypothetical protein
MRTKFWSGNLKGKDNSEYLSIDDNIIMDIREIRGCIQKFSDWVDNEIYDYSSKHSLRGNTKGYGSKTH